VAPLQINSLNRLTQAQLLHYLHVGQEASKRRGGVMSIWTIVALASLAVSIAGIAVVLVSAAVSSRRSRHAVLRPWPKGGPSTATRDGETARDGVVGSNAWAQQVMSEARCRSCRKIGYDVDNLVLGPPRSWYRGRCRNCGETRDFEFLATE